MAAHASGWFFQKPGVQPSSPGGVVVVVVVGDVVVVVGDVVVVVDDVVVEDDVVDVVDDEGGIDDDDDVDEGWLVGVVDVDASSEPAAVTPSNSKDSPAATPAAAACTSAPLRPPTVRRSGIEFPSR